MTVSKGKPKRLKRNKPRQGKLPGGRMNYSNKIDPPNPNSKWILLGIFILLMLLLLFL